MNDKQLIIKLQQDVEELTEIVKAITAVPSHKCEYVIVNRLSELPDIKQVVSNTVPAHPPRCRICGRKP